MMYTIEDLQAFVRINNMGHLSFDSVMKQYIEDTEKIVEEMQAEAYLATMEAHDLT